MPKNSVTVFLGYTTPDEVMVVLAPRDPKITQPTAKVGPWLLAAMCGQHVDPHQGTSLRGATLLTGRLGEPLRALSTHFLDNTTHPQPLWDTERELLVAPEGSLERMITRDDSRPYEFSWQPHGDYRHSMVPLNPASFEFVWHNGVLTVTSKARSVRFVGEAKDGIICITTVGDDPTSTEVYFGLRQGGVGLRLGKGRIGMLHPPGQTYMLDVGPDNSHLYVRPEADIRRGLLQRLRARHPKTGLHALYGGQVLAVLDPSFITGMSTTNNQVTWEVKV